MNKNQIILISGGFVVVTVITYVFFAYHYKLFPFGKSTVEGTNANSGTNTIGNLKIVDFKNMLKTGLDISNDEIVSEFTLILSTLFNLKDHRIFGNIELPKDDGDSVVKFIREEKQISIFNFIKELKRKLTEDATKGSEFFNNKIFYLMKKIIKIVCDKDNTSVKLDADGYSVMAMMEKSWQKLIDLISKAMESEDNVLKANDAIKNATTKKYKIIKEKASTENCPTSSETPITSSLLELVVYTIIATVIEDEIISELGETTNVK